MTGAIILAAGSSSRMGQSKQMLEIRGEKLLTKSVRAVLEAGIHPSVVVLGANEDEHKRIVQGFDTDVTVNRSWRTGMGSSLKAGLKHLTYHHPGISSVVITVCDQPLLDGRVIGYLVEKYRTSGKRIVASAYSDTVGVPVLFDKFFFEEIMHLRDNEGAKKIIRQHHNEMEIVPFPGGEVDLDTMDDYRDFIKG